MLEIEIKSLLGSKEKADIFRQKLLQSGSKIELVYKGKSVNHYFINPTNFELFFKNIKNILSPEREKVLLKTLSGAKDISVRTRETELETILVIKVAVDDTTSSNGTARMEFEEVVKISLSELDHLLIDSGFIYQAKWSREREQYKHGDFNICLDKNAGYGYLVELELMVEDKNKVNEAKKRLRNEMDNFGLVELDQARLARMFDHYNKHWPEYYGTEKVFNIE
jgi:predicted adenylyl cyclase CyaB